MKAAALLGIIAALAILAGAYSSIHHQAEQAVLRAENNLLSEEIAELERRVEIEQTQRSMKQLGEGSEQELADAAGRLSAIEAEILENRAELVQLKSDRLVANEYAKSSLDKLQEQVREATEIEKGLVKLQSQRLQIRNHIAEAEEKAEALTGIITDKQDHATGLDRKLAELIIREEAARSRLIIAEEAEASAETSIASIDDPNKALAEIDEPSNTAKTSEAKPQPAPPADEVIRPASTSTEEAQPSDLDRSKGLYRFKTLTVDRGLGGPAAIAKSEVGTANDSIADEQKTSDTWASNQYELGRKLVIRGEQNSGTRELNEAVLAFKSALGEWARDRDPVRWAATQNDLGYALALLGQRQGDVGTLENAAIACRNALAEIKQDRTPLLWAAAQYNLGVTLSGIAQIKDDRVLWKNAIKALQQSAEAFEKEGADAEEGKARNRLENAHEGLAVLKK